MKVLVTGGTGFIGSHTCIELLVEGHTVTILDNLSNSSPEVLARIARITGSCPEFYQLDVRDVLGLEQLFAKQSFDALLHFAGVKAVAESVAEPFKYYSNNVRGSIALFDVAVRYGVCRLVFSSSAAVYGETTRSPIGEDALIIPANPYGWSKHMVEEVLANLCLANPWLRAVALRYFNPMPYICQVAIGTLPELTIFGNDYPTPDGTAIRDYVHVVDLAQGHIKALDYLERESGMHVINLGTGQGTSVLEMLSAFERVNDVIITRRFGARRLGDTTETYADVALAAKQLSWHTRLSLEDMCRDAWHWQNMNPAGYAKCANGDYGI